jgi:hypothetical protein
MNKPFSFANVTVFMLKLSNIIPRIFWKQKTYLTAKKEFILSIRNFILKQEIGKFQNENPEDLDFYDLDIFSTS